MYSFLNFVCECFACTLCLCTTSVPGVRGGEKMALEPQELNLEMDVNDGSWGLGIKTASSARATECSEPLSHVSLPHISVNLITASAEEENEAQEGEGLIASR